MGNALSTGMGQGVAQVFNTNGPANVLIAAMKQNILNEQKSKETLAKEMTKIDAERGKLRAVDVPEFNKLYDEYYSLHVNNKGLYSNPAKYPDAYKRKLELQGQMDYMVRESSENRDNIKMGMQSYVSNPLNFEEGTDKYLGQINNMTSPQIRNMFGGTFNPSTLEALPKPYNWDAFVKGHQTFQLNSNGATIISDITKNEKPGYLNVVTGYKYDPVTSAMYATEKFNTDGAFARAMNKEFKTVQSNPDKLNKMQTELNTLMGDKSFEIKDPASYAQAYTALNFRKNEKVSVTKDSEYFMERNQRHQMQMKRMSLSGSKIKDPLPLDVAGLVDLLSQDTNGDINNYNAKTAKVANILAEGLVATEGQTRFFGRERVDLVKNRDKKNWDPRKKFIEDFKKLNAKSLDGYAFGGDDNVIGDLYDRNITVALIPIKDNKEIKYIPIVGDKRYKETNYSKLMGAIKRFGVSDSKGTALGRIERLLEGGLNSFNFSTSEYGPVDEGFKIGFGSGNDNTSDQ